MQRSVDWLLTTHQGSLARPRELMEIGWAKFEALSEAARLATRRVWGGDHDSAA